MSNIVHILFFKSLIVYDFMVVFNTNEYSN